MQSQIISTFMTSLAIAKLRGIQSTASNSPVRGRPREVVGVVADTQPLAVAELIAFMVGNEEPAVKRVGSGVRRWCS